MNHNKNIAIFNGKFLFPKSWGGGNIDWWGGGGFAPSPAPIVATALGTGTYTSTYIQLKVMFVHELLVFNFLALRIKFVALNYVHA